MKVFLKKQHSFKNQPKATLLSLAMLGAMAAQPALADNTVTETGVMDGLESTQPPQSSANSLSLGLGAAMISSEYRGVDEKYRVSPLIRYESERFFVRDLSAGVRVFSNNAHQLNVVVAYQYRGFDPGDSDDNAMRRLDKRRSTAMAGVSYRYSLPYGSLRVSAMADILDNSQGLILDAGYQYAWRATPQVTIMPQIGVSWFNEKHNDYYYGISAAESARSGLSQFEGKSSFSPYAVMSANYRITPKWSLFGMGLYRWLPSRVKDSPMVDQSGTYVISVGVRYHF